MIVEKSTVQIKEQFVVPESLDGMRLDACLANLLPDYSRNIMKRWITDGNVYINGNSCRPRDKVHTDDDIKIDAEMQDRTTAQAEAIDLVTVFEDEDVLVINKPPGLVAQPARGNWEGTLVNALLHHSPELSKLPRAGLIHRLDKDTSGLLVIAKTLQAHTWLVDQLQQREVKRMYWAIAQGELISGGTIEAAMGRHPKQRTKMAVVENGKPATTHYRILERFINFTLVNVQLETGRTHQIRVHFAHKGYPLLGDSVYNGRMNLPKKCPPEMIEAIRDFKRQALHAHSLGFIHPKTKVYQEWEAPLPDDMLKLLECLRKFKKET